MSGVDVRVNGQPIQAQVKVIEQGHTLAQAKSIIADQLDGYDTYGVHLADGRDALVLTQSTRDLRKRDQLSIDGKPAAIQFVENETNTSSEVKWARFGAFLNGAATVLNAAAAVNSESTGGAVLHGALTAFSADQLSHNLSDLSQAMLTPNDAVTSGIARPLR